MRLYVDEFEKRLEKLDEDDWDMLTSPNGFYGWEILIPYVSAKTRALMSVYMNYERVHGAYIIGRVSDEDEIKAACEEFNALSDYLERITARDYMDEIGNAILLTPEELESFYNEISVEDMALALKGCSPRMRAQILDKMEGRKFFDINYQMECMGPVRLDDVEEAQGRVLKAILEAQKY